MRVYISASVKDMDRAGALMRALEGRGVDTLHDWTGYSPDPDAQAGPAAFEEFRKQRKALSMAHLQVILHHPRNKAAWMEYGFAIGRNIPVIGVSHPLVRDSLWFRYERYTQVDSIEDAVSDVVMGNWMAL